MKTVKLFTLLLLLSSLFFVSACGDDGSPGPSGEQGPKGDKGEAGNGAIYSDWISLVYTQEIVDGESKGFSTNITDDKLTKDVLISGEVRMYINLTSAAEPTIAPLPYLQDNGGYVRFAVSPGTIKLRANINASTANINNEAVRQYRYIIIPGNKGGRKATDINWDNYAEVKAHLNLAD